MNSVLDPRLVPLVKLLARAVVDELHEIPTSGTPARTKGKRDATISQRAAAHGKTVAPGVGQSRTRLR